MSQKGTMKIQYMSDLHLEFAELKKKYPRGKFTFKKKRVRYDDDYGGFREMPDE